MSDTMRTYSVPEITCGHCKESIEAAVSPLVGVRRVDVDIDAKTVAIDGGEDRDIVSAIEDIGFDVLA